MEFSAILTSDQEKLKLTFHNNHNSSVEIDDIQNIPSACCVDQGCDEEKYNEAIQSLIDNYFALLGGKLNEDHLFAFVQQEAFVLPSKDSSLVPLAFPKKLMENLEVALLRDKFFVECTGLGYLHPVSYDLRCLYGSDYYQLTIQYNFVPKEENKMEHSYCEFVVAEFDKNIVHAFGDVSITDEGFTVDSVQLNEFLIQAFFCDLKPVLGFPGPGTWRLKGSLVAPKEHKFEGLFNLLNVTSQQKLRFGINKREFHEVYTLRPDFQNYLRVQYEAKHKMKQFEGGLNAYRHHYQLMMACLKLQTSISEQNLKELLFNSFGLIPPEVPELMHLDVMEKKDPDAMERTAFMFEALINKCPSEIKVALETHYKNLEELKTSLKDDVDPVLQLDIRKSNYINI